MRKQYLASHLLYARLKRRLMEFRSTPAALMDRKQFELADFSGPSECLPPIVLAQQKKNDRHRGYDAKKREGHRDRSEGRGRSGKRGTRSSSQGRFLRVIQLVIAFLRDRICPVK